MGAHPAIAPLAEAMGGLGSIFYAYQWLSGTTLEAYVAKLDADMPGRPTVAAPGGGEASSKKKSPGPQKAKKTAKPLA